MDPELAVYRQTLAEVSPQIAEVLDAVMHEASRNLSPAGLRNYLEGARGLSELGRGPGPVLAFLEAMPALAREIGEDQVKDCALAAMKLASITSGEVIAMFLATAPNAARRLGDADLFAAYVQFLHQLSARAPRGLRPMFGVLDDLLHKLSLGGLRRWAFFGAEAHRTDFKTQSEYFALKTPDSLAMLQKERKGALFVDHQRKLTAYLRALWGREFYLRPASAEYAEFQPFIEDFALRLPDAAQDEPGLPGLDLFRAAAAHMAAHLVYMREPISAQELTQAQMVLIGFIEDARVENLAMRDLPGLKSLWRPALAVERGPLEHPSQALLERLALALLDPEASTGDAEADAFARRFHETFPAKGEDANFAWGLGLELYHLLANRRALPSLRQLQRLRLTHRDDNRYIWAFAELDWAREAERIHMPKQTRRRVSLMEFVNEVEVETAGDDAQEVWTLDGTLYDDDDTTYNEKYGTDPVSDPFPYHEWDYQAQTFRPDWAILREFRSPPGDASDIDAIVSRHKPVASRLRQIVDKLRPQGVQRERKLEDGDEIDVNAAVDFMIDLRLGRDPDPRITMRNRLKTRDLAVLILLDLSESTNDPAPTGEQSILGLTRDASALLSRVLSDIGDPFALDGFCSDGRGDVKYFPLKPFETRFDDTAKTRLAGMKGGFSTRMGAALRHAGAKLRRQPQKKKLILLVTDGEPADVDERDPNYLRRDAKKAVEELSQSGVHTFCLTLDPRADHYVQRIFGAKGYTVVDKVERLPERLPQLFAELTG